ncbi:dimethylsulfonioproprionate lyase family protein [Phaeobacter marinintestinus]|uniref:dimethylsulfonioproprionate lyase family protein n=1 Tax=Falsiphaeobacter marinintestinus TaxID=1492905 RepID=UPI001645E2F7|nr:dimethylsulfonioproprionate lyase family protein [Phaeobacter marinintestinus]
MSDVIRSFLNEMADAFRTEDRTEAQETAQTLASAAFAGTAPADFSDSEAIRTLLFASPHPCAASMLAAHDKLPWGVNPVARKARTKDLEIYAVCDLMGPDSPVYSGHLRAGIYYQRPNLRYALHSHAAAETYVIVAGSALWTAGDTRKLLGPGDAVHHSTYLPHACQTGPEGVIALWRWSGDIGTDSYRIHDGQDAFAA